MLQPLGPWSGRNAGGVWIGGSVRESYLLALCLTLAGALAAISLLFVRRERTLRRRLTRDELTGLLSQQELHRHHPVPEDLGELLADEGAEDGHGGEVVIKRLSDLAIIGLWTVDCGLWIVWDREA